MTNMSIEEQHLLLELKMQINKGNVFVTRRELSNLLQKAEKLNMDGFKLLFEALKATYQEQVSVISTGLTQEITSLECNMCGKTFKNGLNSWKGNKRFCKNECTKNDLKKWNG